MLWTIGFCLLASVELAQGLSFSRGHEAVSELGLTGPSAESMGRVLAEMVLASDESQAQNSIPEAKNLAREKKSLVHELREVGRVDDIPILTIATQKAAKFEFPGPSGLEVDNLGAGQIWEARARTKNKLLKKYIDEHMDTPDKLVVMLDGGDIVFGGCDSSTLRSTYESTVKASGTARIVMGAEFGVYPHSMMKTCFRHQHNQEPYESTRKAVLKAVGMPVINRAWNFDHFTEMFNESRSLDAPIKYDFIDDVYADRTVCNYHWSFCSNPPRYQFANYGFVMGPVGALKPFIDAINQAQEDNPREIDQKVALKYHVEHPEQVTLDYSGTLVLNLHNLLGDSQPMIPPFLKIDTKKSKVMNTLTGKDQCFMHGNGRSKPLVKKLAKEMNMLFKNV